MQARNDIRIQCWCKTGQSMGMRRKELTTSDTTILWSFSGNFTGRNLHRSNLNENKTKKLENIHVTQSLTQAIWREHWKMITLDILLWNFIMSHWWWRWCWRWWRWWRWCRRSSKFILNRVSRGRTSRQRKKIQCKNIRKKASKKKASFYLHSILASKWSWLPRPSVCSIFYSFLPFASGLSVFAKHEKCMWEKTYQHWLSVRWAHTYRTCAVWCFLTVEKFN